MMRLRASLVPFVFQWTVGQLTQGSLHKNFGHLLCLFIIVFPLRIPETVIKHRNNSCSFFFEISITFLGSNYFTAFIPDVLAVDMHSTLHIHCGLRFLVEVVFCLHHRPVAPPGKKTQINSLKVYQGLIQYYKNHKPSQNKPKGIPALVLIHKINVKALQNGFIGPTPFQLPHCF